MKWEDHPTPSSVTVFSAARCVPRGGFASVLYGFPDWPSFSQWMIPGSYIGD